MNSLQPDVELDFAALENSTDRNSELFATMAAFVKAGTMRFALKFADTVNSAAVWTDDAISPTQRLKMLARLVCVLEMGLVENRCCHD
jgi:hypothetical protein